MPKLTTHHAQTSTKMLLIGDSGTGKTGALAALVKAGYELVILDFDNGLDILVNILRKEPNAEELLGRVYFETVTDKMKSVGGNVVTDGPAKAFIRAMNLLTNWKVDGTDAYDLGPVSSWTDPKRILVIDSLTLMSSAAYRWAEQITGNNDKRAVYGVAQDRVESCLQLLYSDEIKCNVIITSHLTFVEGENGVSKGYPSAVGKALSPKIPRYFNTVVQVKVQGTGQSLRRILRTQPDGMVDLKTSAAPGDLPIELPLESGLVQIFKSTQGQK